MDGESPFPAFEGRVLPVDAIPIVTRNMADFEPTGVQVVNPWETVWLPAWQAILIRQKLRSPSDPVRGVAM